MKNVWKSVAFLVLFLGLSTPGFSQEISTDVVAIPPENPVVETVETIEPPVETAVPTNPEPAPETITETTETVVETPTNETVQPPVVDVPSLQPTEEVLDITPEPVTIAIIPTPEVVVEIPTPAPIIEEVIPTEPVQPVVESVPTPEPVVIPKPVVKKKPVVKLPKPTPKDLYSVLGQENYRYPSRPRRKNLDLEVDGFYEIKYSGRDYSPKDPDDPRFERIVRDPIYNKIPRDVLLGPSKMDIRYQIQIDGKLDDDLSVHYDIEQEPDFPGKYEVQVKYKDKELTFFHYDAFFENGEFIQVKKALNGAQYYQETPYSELRVATGRQRSEPKKFSTFGNGQKEYRLGNTSILRGSVTVWLNNKRRKEGADYKINYFDGTIEFTESPQKSDFIEVVYEFTNPIEDFLPVLSRKNFFGAQMKWRSKDKVSKVKLNDSSSEVLWSKNKAVLVNTSETVEENIVTNNQILSALSELMNEEETVEEEADNTADTNLDQDEDVKNETEEISDPGNYQDAPRAFKLENSPVVLGSDVVYVNDRELIRNMDYFIEHTSGEIRLRNPILPTDKLKVDYDYYLTDRYKEDIIGDGTPGPYSLDSKYVLDGSVKIDLEGTELLETRDFIMDYDNGRIFFNYKIKYPKIMTVEYRSIQSKTVTLNAEKRPLNVGVTYLNEYAKSEEEELTLSVASENVTVSGNILQTDSNPIINTENIVIFFNGERITTADYEIENLYKGQIRLISHSSGPAVISYDYRKSFRTKHTFEGDGRSTFYINGEDKFILRDIPMKYNGISFIRIWNGTEEILLENDGSAFEVDYGETGEDVEIRFIRRQDGSGVNASRLDFYPTEGQPITVEYDFTPAQSQDPGDINQRMIGVTVGGNITDRWRIDTEVVAADHNFSKPRVTVDSPIERTGTGQDNQVYDFGIRNIVEDSELIFVNDILLTKDKDYIINYIQGTVKFRNLTPGTEDTIKATFEYFDSGVTESGQQTEFKYATKLSTTYESDNVQTKAHFKHIDKDFLPIAPIQEKKGTTVFGGSLGWDVNKDSHLDLEYNHRREDKGTNDINKTMYLKQDDFKGSLRARLFDIVDTTNSFRYDFQLEDPKDPSVTLNKHATDMLTYGWDSNLSFGPSHWKTSAAKSFSRSISDYVDQDAPIIVNTSTHRYSSTYTSSDFPVLKQVTFKPSYQNSLADTHYSISPTLSYTNRQVFGFDSDFKPFRGFSGSTTYSFEDIRNKTSATVTENKTSVLNTGYNLQYKPFSWFQARWDLQHSETESPLNAQLGKKSDTESFAIPRFSLFGALTATGMSHQNPLIKPLKGSYFTASSRTQDTAENNNKKTFHSLNNDYSFNSFSPIKGITFNNLRLNLRNSNLDNDVETSTASGNATVQRFERRNGALTVAPEVPVLRLFKYTYNFEETVDNKESETFAPYATGNIITEKHPLFRRDQKVELKPQRVFLPTPFGKLSLGNFSTSLQEFREEKTNTTITQKVASGLDAIQPAASRSEDSSLTKTYTWVTNFSPFNLFSVTTRIVSTDAIIKRNLSNDPSVTYRDELNGSLSLNYSPFRFLSFSGNYNRNRLNQFISPSLDIKLADIKSAQSAEDFDNFTSFLYTRTETSSLQSTLTPFKFFSLRGGASVSDTKQINVTESNPDFESTINQKVGNAGAVLRPIKGMSISYDYSIKLSRDSSGANSSFQEGYTGVTSFVYTPIKRRGISVDIKYTRQDNWGFGINSLANSGSEIGTGQSVKLEVTEQDNTEELGSLAVNINIPITKSPFIQSLVIQGEGYLKKITDRQDDLVEDENSSALNSLEIGGFVLKGTLLF